ncbi:hypothetical protein B0H14DRAFT_2618006 [Mycena olivaceomarginata]|nr:hypothetical protein B0H14DRAFT_2618006 [Mycena olivaceomarginata]
MLQRTDSHPALYQTQYCFPSLNLFPNPLRDRTERATSSIGHSTIPAPPPEAEAYRIAPIYASEHEVPFSEPEPFLMHRNEYVSLECLPKIELLLMQLIRVCERFSPESGPFDSLGDLLLTLFHNRAMGSQTRADHRMRKQLRSFLTGRSAVWMAHIFPLLLKHRSSFSSKDSARIDERDLMFSSLSEGLLSDIHHARPFLTSWYSPLPSGPPTPLGQNR